MKKLLLCLALSACAVFAQNNMTTAARQRYFNPVRRSLEASSDVMPADKYSFKLTPDQMSFAEWLIHSADRNYADCATLKGESAPDAKAKLPTLKSKDEVSKALKDSFAYCAAALDSMDDQKAGSTPAMATAFLHVIVHNNEIYGNIVGYMRASGIVPPSTAARSNQKK
ncbi:MAG: DinB family protein [Acidobacteriia bacterium]|nr:DinB family protein [Terriglobia bacterium]